MTKILLVAGALLATLMVAQSCKTTKYTPTDFPDEQITFGSGGGFSGIVNDYTLLANGQLFKRSSTDNKFVELKKLKKNEAKQAFKNYQFLGINNLTVNSPGNLYYFIQYKDKDKKEHKLVWGDNDAPIDQNLKTYYDLLSTLVPKDPPKN